MSPTPNWIKKLLHSAQYRAERQGQVFDLTAEDVQRMWTEQDGKCHWFRVPMVPVEDSRHPMLPSIDRVFPALGYTPGNVVLSCWAANAAKGQTDPDTWEEFLGFLKAGMASEE